MLLRLIHLNCRHSRQYRSLLTSNNVISLKRIKCNLSSSSNRNSEAELIDSGSVVCNAKMSFQAGEGDMSKLLSLAQKFNCFYLSGLALEECRPFVVEGFQVGLIRPDFLKELLNYPEVFNVTSGYVELNPAFRNYDERSTKVDAVLRKLRSEKKFITLKGWRNECYDVKREFVSSSFLKMDRCATCLFGIRNYGVDINGYVKHPTLGLCLWVQQRSATKQTWPGKWDNMVGGGLSVGHGILETAYKESQEEASIPMDITKNLVSAGCVSFFFESERGLFPNTVFVYDLELPLEFIPINADGEVEKFELLPASVCLERICTADFKTTSAPVVLDFMIRHGVVTVENEKALTRIVELLHVPLQTIYKNHLTPNHVKTKENGTTNANI